MGTIAVLGLGPSINLFQKEEPYVFDVTIGVNDIWRYVKTDIVVCLDKPAIFNIDRIKYINECRPKVFYSQMVVWDSRPDFRKIDFVPGYPDRALDINNKLFYKSYCSPFVACQIAYRYYNATEIHIFGVDLRNHPHLNGQLCISIKRHFGLLKEALRAKDCKMIVHGNGILAE